MRFGRPASTASTDMRTATLGVLAAFVLASCATVAPDAPVLDPKVGERTVLASATLDRDLEQRILALDPERVSGRDVADVLARAPAPRIMLIHGGVYPVHLAMTSFGGFLVSMGYPEARIRPPGSFDWSYSPYTSTSRLAGIAAWYYEQDGMRPMIVGHSQGGLYAVKVLKQLAGRYGDSLSTWDPHEDRETGRTTIVDPLTDRVRPVIGVSLSYASSIGAGGLALLLPNQWDDFSSLRRIPGTVEEFTGYFITLDLIALSFPGNPFDVPYTSEGAARVRNVTLPVTTNHVFVPVTGDYASDPALRAWIDAYRPGEAATSTLPEGAGGSVLWAADVWYSIKKHWTIEAQRFVRARQASPGANPAGR
jgi:hypothetical protein